MKLSRKGVVFMAAIPALLSGCCVSHSIRVRNNTSGPATITAKAKGDSYSIPAGKRRTLPLWRGPLLVTAGTNVWSYSTVDFLDHPEARKRVFRFGICQAGFGYFRTAVTLEAEGNLVVGNGVYQPDRTH
jgi:hypothetical protein